MSQTKSRYLQVKTYLLDGIGRQEWKVGDRVPSENELVTICQVSRMTARRALHELYTEGTLVRIKGKGSYVANEKQQSSLLQIRSIAAEIKALGYQHYSKLLHNGPVSPETQLDAKLEMFDEQPIVHSQLLHFQNDTPIQLEHRWVNLSVAPEYGNQNFRTITPSEYLTSIAPVTEAEHQVEAIIGDENIRDRLKVSSSEAILLLERKTWCHENLVSFARLYHPGDRYRLGTKFTT